jgi:hypothetical protein
MVDMTPPPPRSDAQNDPYSRGTGVNWTLDCGNGVTIHQWKNYLKAKRTVDISDPLTRGYLRIDPKDQFAQNREIMDLILRQSDPVILVSFFEKTNGLIVINQNEGAIDVYYNGVDLDYLKGVMRFAEEAHAIASCSGADKQRK